MSTELTSGIVSNVVKHTDGRYYGLANDTDAFRIVSSTNGVSWTEHGSVAFDGGTGWLRSAVIVMSGDIIYYCVLNGFDHLHYVGRFNIVTDTNLELQAEWTKNNTRPQIFMNSAGTHIIAGIQIRNAVMGTPYDGVGYTICAVGGAWSSITKLYIDGNHRNVTEIMYFDGVETIYIKDTGSTTYWSVDISTETVSVATWTTGTYYNNHNGILKDGDVYSLSATAIVKGVFTPTSITFSDFVALPAGWLAQPWGHVQYDSTNGIWHVVAIQVNVVTNTVTMQHAAYDGSSWSSISLITETPSMGYYNGDAFCSPRIDITSATTSSVDVFWSWQWDTHADPNITLTTSRHLLSTVNFSITITNNITAALVFAPLELLGTVSVFTPATDITGALVFPALEILAALSQPTTFLLGIQLTHSFIGVSFAEEDTLYLAELDNGETTISIPIIWFTIRKFINPVDGNPQTSLTVISSSRLYAEVLPYLGQTLTISRSVAGIVSPLLSATIDTVFNKKGEMIIIANEIAGLGSSTIPLQKVSFISRSGNSAIIRSQPTPAMKPGDISVHDGVERKVLAITTHISASARFSEVLVDG